MGPKAPRSTVLTSEEEAAALAFRRHTLLPLADCLYGICQLAKYRHQDGSNTRFEHLD